MGMFDSLKCKATFPSIPELEGWDLNDIMYQTKSLDCVLCVYEISEEGRLIERIEIEPDKPEWIRDLNYHGDVTFYAPIGELFVTFAASFYKGGLRWIECEIIERT